MTKPDHETPSYRAGADIGGTFTDVILAAPDGSFTTRKVLTTTDDFSRGIVEALSALVREIGAPDAAIAEIVHGTTVATNAILEENGARTGLITTRGFRDVLELRRLRTPQLYDRYYQPPRPIVERRLRTEVAERLDAAGNVLLCLDESSIDTAIDRLQSENVTAVAVCLLHSFRNPAHERRVGQRVRERLPEVFLSLSVDVLPEIREYERTSTTVLNAYVGPIVRDYLDSLGTRLSDAGIRARLQIMQSNGGVMSVSAATDSPARIVESGPAAGVIAAQAAGMRSGFPNVISFDMGGTTAKASLIEQGTVARTTEYEVGAGISLSSRLVKGGGHALKLPVIDIAEVGAGGGSIVWIDRGGALKVGPRSAGAMPGPACHATGGNEPAITDANLLLGHLNPAGLAGGAIPLRSDLAERALSDSVSKRLGMSLLEAAFGAFTIANIMMIRALKAVSTYRGRDPRDFVLMAFGGNGPIHATGIARDLGIRTVVVPPFPGLFSASGLLAARPERHFAQTLFGRLDQLSTQAIARVFGELERRATEELDAEDGNADMGEYSRSVDLRYAGQGFELTVDAPAGDVSSESISITMTTFEQEHERMYGHSSPGEPVELVNVRLVVRSPESGANPGPPSFQSSRRGFPNREVFFGPESGLVSVPVVGRDELDQTPQPGPLIVEENDATTVVPIGAHVRIDGQHNIIVDLRLDGASHHA